MVLPCCSACCSERLTRVCGALPAQDLEQAALLLGRSEEERARLEAELRASRMTGGSTSTHVPELPVRLLPPEGCPCFRCS